MADNVCLQCSTTFSVTLPTEILSTETLKFLIMFFFFISHLIPYFEVSVIQISKIDFISYICGMHKIVMGLN